MDAYKLPIHLRRFHLKKLEESLKKEKQAMEGHKGSSSTAKVPKFAMAPQNIKGKSR